MDSLIPQIEAKNILLTYTGFNNQLLYWKKRLETERTFNLTKTQAEYVFKYHTVQPKVAKKYINIIKTHGEKIKEDYNLAETPTQIWCEKLLCESDKAYHIYGKYNETDYLKMFWLPKTAVILPEKKLNREIDYSKYSVRPPMEHQKVAIEKLLANNKYILGLDMGLGKLECVNNKVFTPYGRTKIGTLKIGDKIIGSDGLAHNVTGIFPQGIKELYKITFNDGYSLKCGKEHLWSVYTSNHGPNTNNQRVKKRYVLSTEQMLDNNGELYIAKNRKIKTYYIQPNGNLKWQIDIVKPIQFNNSYELPIDPYLLGLCLGDGHITDTKVTIQLHKDDYYELLNNYDFKETKPCDNKRSGNKNFENILIDLKLDNTRSHTKFIPEIYKYSSVEDRLAIIQGLMDTDGTVLKIGTNRTNKENFQGTEYCTVSEKLCDDVAEIVHSLGGICRKRSRIGKYKKNGITVICKKAYRLNIKLPEGMNPFRLKRKADLYNIPKKYKVGRYIKNIEPCGEGEAICISVDSPDKLYVTEHAIVTHNTTAAVIASLECDVKKVLIVCPATLKINWKKEIENYTDKKVLIVEGRKWGHTFDYYIINYDIIKNYHSVDKKDKDSDYNLLVNEKFDLAIVDEAHYLSNPSANRTLLLNDVLEKIPKVWLLTGTPMTSRPMNFYNLLKIVNSPVTLNWQHYVKRYCKGYQFTVNKKKVWNTSGASNLDELRELTKNLMHRKLKTEILDLPEKIITPIYIELKSSMYNEEIEEFIKIAEKDKRKDKLTIDITTLMRVRQLIAYEKIPYTCELIDKCIEQGKKVVILTNFTIVLDILHEKYKKNSVVLDGRMSSTKKQESVDKFQDDDKIKIFFGNIVAAGVGITLTAGEVVIMNDLSFVPAHHAQGEDRCFRIGQKKSVSILYPIFENTIEMIVYNILDKKKNIIDEVMGDGEYSESFTTDLVKELKENLKL